MIYCFLLYAMTPPVTRNQNATEQFLLTGPLRFVTFGESASSGGKEMEGFLAAFTLVFFAEMGDKTQLIVMAFTARYSWRPVMAAVLAATLANHGLAVLLGVLLGGLLPETEMRFVGSAAFIVFGLLTLREGEDDKDEVRRSRSPFWTVALTFFLGEMGDKTQLAVLTIAADRGAWLPVLAGSTAAMLVADGLGVLLGAKLRRHVSPRRMKQISALVFILCGLAGFASLFA